MVNIYSLSDPITGEIRYVGKTVNTIQRRLTYHLQNAKRYKHYTANWINSLKKKNLKPIVELLDVVEAKDWEFWERYWIAQCKAWGFKLTNYTEGGCGGSNSETPSNSKKVYLYDCEGNYLAEFLTIKKLGRFLNTDSSNIVASIKLDILCKGHRVTFEKYDKLPPIISKRKKEILQYDLDNNLLNEFPSARVASQKTGVSYKYISLAALGKIKTSAGFKWKFKTNRINN
jgi:NUMOD1 domain/GIY-YIG catalytic domain